ncbi:hypothetical protein [Halorussus halobius]|uniref:hypothetical protein n=1 Tax=Halorussus halobius TaxID=1710537 RepID=UPI001091BA40|nr:hypothetical protein [Halorussus halobius]
MVRRETKLVGTFAPLAFGLFLVVSDYTDLGAEAAMFVLLVVGVVVPQVLLRYTEVGGGR